MVRFARLAAALASSALVLLPARAWAVQFVVTDVTYTHSATTTTDSHLRIAPSAQTPINWVAPVNYTAGGTAHVRLEVFTKPSAAPTRFQICFEANAGSYACTDQAPTYTAPGVYDWVTPMPNFYQFSTVDWTKGVAKVALILKDDKNGKPAPENVGPTVSAMYMPSNVRVTVTMVSPGGTYVPPPPTPADAGAPDASIGDGGSTDAGSTADGAAALPDAAGTDDAGSSPSAPAADDGGGCATAPGSSPMPVVLAMITALGAVWVRRRRRSAP